MQKQKVTNPGTAVTVLSWLKFNAYYQNIVSKGFVLAVIIASCECKEVLGS